MCVSWCWVGCIDVLVVVLYCFGILLSFVFDLIFVLFVVCLLVCLGFVCVVVVVDGGLCWIKLLGGWFDVC